MTTKKDYPPKGPTKEELLEIAKKLQEKSDIESEMIKKMQAEKEALGGEDIETLPGSNEIKNPRYFPGSKITVKRSNGEIENDWWVSSTRLTKEGRTVHAHKGEKYQSHMEEGTVHRDFIEKELDKLNNDVDGKKKAETKTPENKESTKEKNDRELREQYYDKAVEIITKTGNTTFSNLEKKFKISSNRAKRLIEMLKEGGVIKEEEKPKEKTDAEKAAELSEQTKVAMEEAEKNKGKTARRAFRRRT